MDADPVLVHNTCAIPRIWGPRPAGDGLVPYIYNVATGRFQLGIPGQIHYDIYRAFGDRTPFGQWVGGFAKFRAGKFVDADLSSGTFSGTQEMIDAVLEAIKSLRGS